MNLETLLSYGYFPKELPPPFTTYPFGQFAKRKKGFPSIPNDYKTKPCLHNLARPGNHRRVLAIPNPFNYYQVAKLLHENSAEIEDIFDKSKISLSRPVIDSKHSQRYVPAGGGKAILQKRIKLRAGGLYIIQTDISRFYHSIYTHTIPWAIMGKENAKMKRRGGLGNLLDLYLMNGQDGQTMGIPVGPDASFIISEIIGSVIDQKLKEKRLRGIRFVDDFEFVFLSKSAAERALPIVEEILKDYELGLNHLKTHIYQLPQQIENSWRLQLKSFPFSDNVSNSQILEYFDLLFDLSNLQKGQPVIRYGLARLRSVELSQADTLMQLLLQCVLVEPGTLKEVLSLVQKLNLELPSKKFASILRNVIKIHGPLQHGSEIAWALWAAILYNIPIPDNVIKKIKGFNDSVVAILALHLHKKGLVSDIVVSFWSDLMTTKSLDGEHWLLAYEADLKGWLPSQEEPNHVKSHPLFSKLKKAKISFYADDLDDLTDREDEYNPYEEMIESSGKPDDLLDEDGLPF